MKNNSSLYYTKTLITSLTNAEVINTLIVPSNSILVGIGLSIGMSSANNEFAQFAAMYVQNPILTNAGAFDGVLAILFAYTLQQTAVGQNADNISSFTPVGMYLPGGSRLYTNGSTSTGGVNRAVAVFHFIGA
jgi:hypothetical protein